MPAGGLAGSALSANPSALTAHAQQEHARLLRFGHVAHVQQEHVRPSGHAWERHGSDAGHAGHAWERLHGSDAEHAGHAQEHVRPAWERLASDAEHAGHAWERLHGSDAEHAALCGRGLHLMRSMLAMRGRGFMDMLWSMLAMRRNM